MPHYAYRISGTDRDGHTWATIGAITVPRGDFTKVTEAALVDSFEQVTQRRAIYGDLSTCHGPYTIRHVTIELQDEAAHTTDRGTYVRTENGLRH